MTGLRELTQKIINQKNKEKEQKHFIEDILIYKTIQTLEEYIADNLEAKNRYQKAKANARIEAYEDCINLLKEVLKTNE